MSPFQVSYVEVFDVAVEPLAVPRKFIRGGFVPDFGALDGLLRLRPFRDLHYRFLN